RGRRPPRRHRAQPAVAADRRRADRAAARPLRAPHPQRARGAVRAGARQRRPDRRRGPLGRDPARVAARHGRDRRGALRTRGRISVVSASPRPATPDDVDAVVDLVESAYRGDASRAGWTTEADLLGGRRTDAAMIRNLLADPRSVLLVLDDDAALPGRRGLLACCQLERREPAADGEAPAAYFGLFAVRPGRQGAGVGSRLLAAAEEMAAGWGARRLELT